MIFSKKIIIFAAWSFIYLMKLLFEQKKPGRLRQSVVPTVLEIDGSPASVGDLIDASVRACVLAFNLKSSGFPDIDSMDADGRHPAVDTETIENLAAAGRVAFGFVYGGRQVDPDKAAADSLQAYEDGIFRIFLNGRILGELNEEIRLNENDLITVVRLTMLAGRLW